ncbi:hypothetical protein ACFLVC_02040 [Chloroflexota bacterium]
MPVETLRPNAVGDLAQLYVFPSDGIHWNKVSEVVPDDDATYVHRYGGTTRTSYDSYHLTDLGISGATITNVQVIARVRRIAMNPSGSHHTTIGLGVRVGGISYFSNYNVSSNSYLTLAINYASNPYTGSNWTAEEIDNLQPLLKMSFVNMAAWQGGLISGRCTQLYVQITYEAPLAVTTMPPKNISVSSVTLNGILDSDGGLPSECGFEWGLTADCGNETSWQSGKDPGDAFGQLIDGLEPDTVYHYRARTRNNAGLATGADMTFRTLKETIEVPPSLIDRSLKLLLEEES